MRILDVPQALMKRLFPEATGGAQVQPSWISCFNDMLSKYATYYDYYSGDVLKEPANPKKPNDGLKYPLQLNLCRQWAHMMSSYLWGEYTDSVVTWDVTRKKQLSGDVAAEEEKRCASMEKVLREAWAEQGNDAKIDTASQDLMVYGGMVPKVYYDSVDGLKTDWLSPEIFCPRWHPMDVTKLMASYIIFDISREDARDVFGLTEYQMSSMPDVVKLMEAWTPNSYSLMVDDREIKETEVNTLGFIPHEYIPRMRTPDNYRYYGLSVVADVMKIQDEVNVRAADIGDGVAYSSHPIRWVVNYTGKQDLEVGADALWDLGMEMGGRKPAAGTLDVRGNYDQGMSYVERVERFGRGASFLPAIAFGEDEGSQRSSLTLLVRYYPLLRDIARQRLYLREGLRGWAKKTLVLAARHGLYGASYEESHVQAHIINPTFAAVLPESVENKVNQWNVRIDGAFGTPEEAYRDLGHPDPKAAAENALKVAEQIARAKSITKGMWNGNSDGSGDEPAGARGNPSDNSAARQKRTGGTGQQNQGTGNQAGQDQ